MRFLTGLLFVSLTSIAVAQAPLKDQHGNPLATNIGAFDQSTVKEKSGYTIDMTQVIVDDTGQPIKDQFLQDIINDPQCLKCKSLTLGAAVAHALFAALPSEKDVSGEQKFARGALALRIEHSENATLTASEVTVIKDLIGKLYNGVIVTRVYPLLDPNAGPPQVTLSK